MCIYVYMYVVYVLCMYIAIFVLYATSIYMHNFHHVMHFYLIINLLLIYYQFIDHFQVLITDIKC